MNSERFSYIKNIFREIMETDGSAELVARSFAVATFVALLPTLGFGFLIGLVILFFLPTLHKPAFFGAFALWNPLVQIPLYSLSVWLGSMLYSGMPIMTFDVVLLDHVYNFTRRVFIGNIIVTTTLTIVSYLAIFILIRRIKHRPILPPKTKIAGL